MRAPAQAAGGRALLIVIEHNRRDPRQRTGSSDPVPKAARAAVSPEGTPEDDAKDATSHTGQALRDYELALGVMAIRCTKSRRATKKERQQEGQAPGQFWLKRYWRSSQRQRAQPQEPERAYPAWCSTSSPAPRSVSPRWRSTSCSIKGQRCYLGVQRLLPGIAARQAGPRWMR